MNLTKQCRAGCIGLILAITCAFSANGAEAVDGPATIFTEAESALASGVLIGLDPKASGGRYAAASHDGCVLLTFSLPNERVEVWGRKRGLPILLRSCEGDEIGRLEGGGDGWEWGRFATFEKDRRDTRVEVFVPFADAEAKKKGGKASVSGLDAVAIIRAGWPVSRLESLVRKVEDPAFLIPDADVAIKAEVGSESEHGGVVTANICIDWNRPTVTTSRRQFSLNVFFGFNPDIGLDARYRHNIAYMRPGLLRYHNMSGMMSDPRERPSSWLNMDERTWNGERIAAALDALPQADYERLITIGRWPAWMDQDKDGLLDKDCYGAYAALCADLVRLLNVQQKRGIAYFEVTNERDIVYWLRQMKAREPTRVEDLAEIYNLCATAMKKVDPGIKTGGPAACRGDLLKPLRQFALLTLPNLDFFSYHSYASGNPDESDASVFSKAQNLGRTIGNIRRMLDEVSPGRRIELHLNEYNICYTARMKDLRMTTNKGAVYDALAFIQMAVSGLDAGNAWNEHDGIYGKMDKGYVLRPAAHVFHYFNDWMIGQAVEAGSDQEQKVVPFAVAQEGRRRSWVLINRSAHANRVVVGFTGSAPTDGPVEMARIDASGAGESRTTLIALAKGDELPPFSVTFYSFIP